MGIAAKFTSEVHHAFGLGQVAAEFGLEGDVGEVGLASGKRFLLVGFPEEAGVVEARPQDAFVAAAHEALGVARDVHHGDEGGRQFAIGILHREVFLVVPHDGNQHLFGEFQEPRIEAALDGHGALGEIDQGFQQFVVGLDADGRQPRADAVAALLGGEDDAVIAEALFVIRRGDGDLARAQAAMAAGEGAGAYAGQFEGNGIFAEEGDDPADGTDEARTALAGPVHGFGEVDTEDHAGESFGEDVDDVAARHLLEVGVVLALGSGLHLHLVGLDALLAGESGDRLRGGRFGGTEDAVHAVGLAGRQAFGAQHEAPRGGIEAHGFVRDLELLKGEAQVFQRAGDHPIGDFLGADFEQEGEGGHWAASARVVERRAVDRRASLAGTD